MAARKKAATKKTTRKKSTRKTGPRKAETQATLPKGFTAISSGFNKNWPDEDTKIGHSIQGVVTTYRDVPRPKNKGGNTQVAVIELKDGSCVDVWRSAVLTPLFDEDYEGVEVWIRFDGLGKKKRGLNPAKLFSIAYNE